MSGKIYPRYTYRIVRYCENCEYFSIGSTVPPPIYKCGLHNYCVGPNGICDSHKKEMINSE